MSVVCCRIYDNKIEIASDAITVRGFTQSKSKNIKHSKLMEINDMIIGGVGLSENNNLMFLFAETHKPKDASIESIIRFKFEFDK